MLFVHNYFRFIVLTPLHSKNLKAFCIRQYLIKHELCCTFLQVSFLFSQLSTKNFSNLLLFSSVKVRIFPYLIGREVADNRQLRWMAGANKGISHLDNNFQLYLHVCKCKYI